MLDGYFVAGTDTGVGKTTVAVALMSAMRARGRHVAGLKPIAAGRDPELTSIKQNEDALLLQASSSVLLPYAMVNPIYLDQPIAPHIAAAKEKETLSVSRCLSLCQQSIEEAKSLGADSVVIEAAGGWMVPLNEEETFADFARELALPVVLVVGMRLGCISHTLLTCLAIRAEGLQLAGWVANCTEPDMPALNDNILSLEHFIDAPLMGVIPHFTAKHDLTALYEHYQSFAAKLKI